MPDRELLDRLEDYYDAVPRARAEVEEVGPFTLFVARSGWPYYARPRRHLTASATKDDVERVLARQRQRGVPQALEWVDEVAPGLVDTVEAAGASVERCPLLVLRGTPQGTPGTARILRGDEVALLAASRAAVNVAFSAGGTGVGTDGIAARDASLDSSYAHVGDDVLDRIEGGELVTAAVFDPDAPDLGPVGGGTYSPVGDVAEIAGVGVLPAYRRRGLAAELTHVLATDALGRGVTTIFCSAQSDDVARIYGGVGFVRVGTACIASVEPAQG
jgi:GNAT superfamily N-acetyltransferase